MRPKTITYTLAAADRNGLATDTLGGAGNFTLDGALASGGTVTFDSPRHVSFYSANDDSGVTFTVTGTNRYGETLTEDITGPNATTVFGSKNFATVTQVAGDGATVGNVEVGSGDSAQTQWIPVEYRINAPYGVQVNQTTGSGTVSIEGTRENPFSDSFDEHTAPTEGVGDTPVRAIRASIEEIDGTSGLTMNLTIICP